MLIELEEPFKSMYRCGYLNDNADGRKRVAFAGTDGKIVSGMSYARYLMSVKLGYIVPDHLEVDHKDDDRTNDSIDNLQLLTEEENKLKQSYNYLMNVQVCFGYHCACCDTAFILTESVVKQRIAAGTTLAFCSARCSSQYHYHTSGQSAKGMTMNALKEIDISHLKLLSLQGYSIRKIAKLTGFSRDTVAKYI